MHALCHISFDVNCNVTFTLVSRLVGHWIKGRRELCNLLSYGKHNIVFRRIGFRIDVSCALYQPSRLSLDSLAMRSKVRRALCYRMSSYVKYVTYTSIFRLVGYRIG
eukprot:1573346-Pyramimonas_sp.AAC.1